MLKVQTCKIDFILTFLDIFLSSQDENHDIKDFYVSHYLIVHIS